MTRVPLLTLALLGCAMPAQAQGELRDPMQAPASLRAAADGAASAPAADAQLPQQILIVDGRAYLVVQGRRLGVGERWGEARILAIDEQAVTLSEAGVKRRLPLYQGVEKRPLTTAPAAGRARKKTSEKS